MSVMATSSRGSCPSARVHLSESKFCWCVKSVGCLGVGVENNTIRQNKYPEEVNDSALDILKGNSADFTHLSVFTGLVDHTIA